MPISEPITAKRAAAVRFILPDETEILIPAVSIDQARAALRLDPLEGEKETPLQYITRLQAQAKILFGAAHAHLTGKLAVMQVEEMVASLYIAACGLNAEQYALWQINQRKITNLQRSLAMLQNLDTLTVELAAQLNKLPHEIGAVPLADAVALRESIAKLYAKKAQFEASLHGLKLQ